MTAVTHITIQRARRDAKFSAETYDSIWSAVCRVPCARMQRRIQDLRCAHPDHVFRFDHASMDEK
jgi:hypothetical protein